MITLTEEGNYLANKGKEILALVDSTTANLVSDEIINGEVSIGGGETQAFEIVAIHFQELRTKHPDIKIKLYSGNADDVLEKIDKGLLDFGLVIDPVEKQKYDYVRLPLSDHWGILVNNDHRLAAKQAITSEDLRNTPLLISAQSLVNNQLAEWLGESVDHLEIVGTYNLLYNASLLVKQNTASALCIDGIIATDNTNLSFVPFSPLDRSSQYCLEKIKPFLMQLKPF